MAAIGEFLGGFDLVKAGGGAVATYILFYFLMSEIRGRKRQLQADRVESAAVTWLRDEVKSLREDVEELKKEIETERLNLEIERTKRFKAEESLYAEMRRASALEDRIVELEKDLGSENH